jgi:hypothetical protein
VKLMMWAMRGCCKGSLKSAVNIREIIIMQMTPVSFPAILNFDMCFALH